MTEPYAYISFTEENLTYILKLIPDDDTQVRPMLQKAGQLIFNW